MMLFKMKFYTEVSFFYGLRSDILESTNTCDEYRKRKNNLTEYLEVLGKYPFDLFMPTVLTNPDPSKSWPLGGAVARQSIGSTIGAYWIVIKKY